MAGKAVAKRDKPFYDGFYSMHSDKQLMDIAESTSLPAAMRLFMLASAKSNRWGHAMFKPREIEQSLHITRQAVPKVINSLVSGLVAAPESTKLCLVLSAAVVRRNDRAFQTCIEPTHLECQRRMWVAGIGWEKHEGQWQQIVNDPSSAELIATRTTRRRRIVEETETIEQVALVPPGVSVHEQQWPGQQWQLPEPWNPGK